MSATMDCARRIDRNDTRGEWIMDFSLARMCFRLSIDIITRNSRAAGTSNDMKRVHSEKCGAQKELRESIKVHLIITFFRLPYDGPLCIVVSFNVIVLLLHFHSAFFAAAADDISSVSIAVR